MNFSVIIFKNYFQNLKNQEHKGKQNENQATWGFLHKSQDIGPRKKKKEKKKKQPNH
jgi:hypothetical protein